MEQENQAAAQELGALNGPTEEQDLQVQPAQEPEKPYRGLKWVFIGDQGLRAGWSVVIFLGVLFALGTALSALFARLHLVGARGNADLTAKTAFFGELMMFLAMLGAAAVVAAIEHRSILDFNLRGPRRLAHFLSGMVVGFAALSALVGALAWGGWLHFGPIALSGSRIFLYAAAWGCAFLLVGCVEEGIMRCYLLFTLGRGMNFWWAVGLV